ncbi:MAG TPA: hypothetical protein VFV73_31365 [Streptosporangiaceae bacterium]|nr:hypothetical protein [Streptosporangiaceae bacterium]
MREPASDSLAVLLLPGKLEGMALEAHARDLLSIPRVIALEPSRVRPPRFLRDSISLRQARRLRFPGQPRLLLLYHAAQYPLARALCARYEDLELWYLSPPGRQDRSDGPAADQAHSREAVLDVLARERARQVLPVTEAGVVDDAPLRERLRELDVINPRAFLPGARPARDGGRPRPGRR